MTMANKRDAIRAQQRSGLSKGLERTFSDTDPAIDEMQTGMGKRSAIVRAKKQSDANSMPALNTRSESPTEAMKRQFLAQNSTDLRAKNGAPTLAQRVAAEGVRAYGITPRKKSDLKSKK
ncbi:hypothetical protein OO17_21570 [Rhodopseudomonas palustris]|uniref:Uncharacterized protein n=3 Tax=Rhodopseudomonas TaxID=1073 RepID=A0A0D7EEU4_RHOPL|nr:hypothetical protein OO17_21570 [Rhodopseudomonas palustris]